MKRLNRDEFYSICEESIKETRADITILNQKSGYLEYSEALTTEDVMSGIRDLWLPLNQENVKNIAKIIEYFGVGYCHELAYYLAWKIGNKLINRKIEATVYLCKSRIDDHAFCRVKIKLKEEGVSHWEVDAWHQRIIDRSLKKSSYSKNNSYIKNTQLLKKYGINPTLKKLNFKDEYQLNFNLCDFSKPLKNLYLPFLEEDINDEFLNKRGLHADYPKEDYIINNQCSFWQKKKFKNNQGRNVILKTDAILEPPFNLSK